VRSSFDDPDAPGAGQDGGPIGTLICDEDEIVEKQLVTGIAYSKDEAKITLRGVEDKPGVAAAIFGPLSESGINVDMIVQNISDDGRTTDITFTVPTADFERSMAKIEAIKKDVTIAHVSGSSDVAKVSVIGIGMRSHAGVAAQAFQALASRGINIQLITTSEIKISVLIDAAYTELAVRTLHSIYELDKT
jgi:aspartate kinase